MADAALAARSGLRNPESRTALGMLIALTAIAPISIDMFLPSMPQMADDFNTSTGVLNSSLTIDIKTDDR